jgi:predicted DNA-binding protein
MPQFSIDLPQRAVDNLQAVVQRTNDNTGAALTLREWIEMHLKEVAIADQLAAAVDTLQKEQEAARQRQLEDGARAARDALLAALVDGSPAEKGTIE